MGAPMRKSDSHLQGDCHFLIEESELFGFGAERFGVVAAAILALAWGDGAGVAVNKEAAIEFGVDVIPKTANEGNHFYPFRFS